MIKAKNKAFKIFALALIFSMLFTVNVFAVGVSVDGFNLTFTDNTGYPFIDENDRTMVPLRLTMESVGAKVEWDNENRTAVVTKDETVVKVKIGEKCVYKNDEMIENDTEAIIKNGRTYLPIRIVLECFGDIVDWDNDAQKVVVKTDDENSYRTVIEHMPTMEVYWYLVEQADALRKEGQYSQALTKYERVISSMLAQNSIYNVAVMYDNIAACYSGLNKGDKAKEMYAIEIEYWTQLGNTIKIAECKKKAELVNSDAEFYAVSINKDQSKVNFFNAPLEPKKGIYIGAYAENDPAVHQPYTNKKFYITDFPYLVDKDHSAYLLYFTYGMQLSAYRSHFLKAKQYNKVIELALQPLKGLDEVNDTDGYLVKLAQDMENSGVKFILRFANEMNDKSNPWYTADYNKYIEKFRMVSKIFKEFAPSVAIVWAPNFSPQETITSYYPGDEYVDYVGISSYQNYNSQNDPLNQQVDRTRWSNQLDYIYSIYGDKKPIIITECGCSYVDRYTGKDITDYTVKQLIDFYAYLPLRYPNIKGVFYFDAKTSVTNYCLSMNDKVLDAYKQAISGKYYLSTPEDSENINEYYFKLDGTNNLTRREIALCTYMKSIENNVYRVEYRINKEIIGASYYAPYRVDCNFAKYKGQTITITANAYNSSGKVIVTKTMDVAVDDF